MIDVLSTEIPNLEPFRVVDTRPPQWRRGDQDAVSRFDFIIVVLIAQAPAHLRLPDAGIAKHHELHVRYQLPPGFEIAKMGSERRRGSCHKRVVKAPQKVFLGG
jgi:hypothetical protein